MGKPKVTRVEIFVHLDNGMKFPIELNEIAVYDENPENSINKIILDTVPALAEPNPDFED